MADYIEQKESKIKVVYRIEDVFQEAAKDLVTYRDWKFLGRRLGLEDCDLLELTQMYDRDGRRETIYQMLCEWKQRNGKDANLPKLSRYLREEQLHRTADLVSTYQLREECNRCYGSGHRRCSHDRIPKHIVRSKTSLNLNKKKIITHYPILPNIKSVTPRVDSGLRGRQRTSSASSTPCATPVGKTRSLSVGSCAISPEPIVKTPLPPITPEPTMEPSQEVDNAPEEPVQEIVQEESVQEPVQDDPVENGVENGMDSPITPQSSELDPFTESENSPDEEHGSPEIEHQPGSPEPETPHVQEEESAPPEEELGAPEPDQPEAVKKEHQDEAEVIENEKKSGRGAEQQPPPEPEQKIEVTATVNVTEIRPLDPVGSIPIPGSIADMFKSMAVHLYQTIVKNPEDHARALQAILDLKDFLIRNITIGSVRVHMECYSDEALEVLREVYLSGTLQRACDQVFNREELLKQCGIKSVKLNVEMDVFDDLDYVKEEGATELTLDLEGAGQSVDIKDRQEIEADKKKKTGRRRSTEVNASVDMKVKFQAQVNLDLSSSSIGQSSLDDKLRLGKARNFHKLISSAQFHRGIIENLNSANNLTDIKYKSIVPKGDFAELTILCSSKNSIQDVYELFLRRDLKRLLEKTLLTRTILREARLDDVTIDVDIDSEHVARCEKKYAEAVIKARGSRYE